MAEFIADIFLCPLEATRIRLVSEPTFAKGVMDGMPKLAATEGMMKGFYSGEDPCPNAHTYTQTANTTTSFSLFPTRRHQRRNCKPCKRMRHARWGESCYRIYPRTNYITTVRVFLGHRQTIGAAFGRGPISCACTLAPARTLAKRAPYVRPGL
jgi:hypothetical protein